MASKKTKLGALEVDLDWKGEELRNEMSAAAVESINEVMAAAVSAAKANHPGWKNVTGAAERSIKIIARAKQMKRGVAGRWGSRDKDAFYTLFLEVLHGSFMRHAADLTYPLLKEKMRKRLA